MKGMLVGGPNANLDDPYAQAVLADKAPALCYVDNEQSYSCNEITIYWNSPLVFSLAGVLSK
jgi:endoglucanase